MKNFLAISVHVSTEWYVSIEYFMKPIKRQWFPHWSGSFNYFFVCRTPIVVGNFISKRIW